MMVEVKVIKTMEKKEYVLYSEYLKLVQDNEDLKKKIEELEKKKKKKK